MALIEMEEAKTYLRVDSFEEDGLVASLLSSAEQLCVDVARLSAEQWEAVNAFSCDIDGNVDETDTDLYTEEELAEIRSVFRVAVLYTLGYFYEHREDADYHNLLLTLRSILFAVREGVF